MDSTVIRLLEVSALQGLDGFDLQHLIAFAL
jgi:hypothetical protein